MEIRSTVADDVAALATLYPSAFPDEDLVPLVAALTRASGDQIYGLVCEGKSGLIGHLAYTLCPTEQGADPWALLGPLAVHPQQQGQGVGRKLITAGNEKMRGLGAAGVLVLGDPALYARFGFAAERVVTPPYELPPQWDGAWQSIRFGQDSHASGRLVVPPIWAPREYWSD